VTATRRRFPLALALVAALSVTASCTSPEDARDDASNVVEIDGAMPDLDLTALDGSEVTSDALAGRPTVVNFWATWCEPCEREQPMLARAAREHTEVSFVGVDFRDEDDAAREWISRYDVPYPSVTDPTGSLASRFGVTTGLPTTIVADADGRLRYRVLGELDVATLERLLREVEAA
jgi:cytochrome c biogenesis protein CcmG, thiol:disulfide interchange protein DsbE